MNNNNKGIGLGTLIIVIIIVMGVIAYLQSRNETITPIIQEKEEKKYSLVKDEGRKFFLGMEFIIKIENVTPGNYYTLSKDEKTNITGLAKNGYIFFRITVLEKYTNFSFGQYGHSPTLFFTIFASDFQGNAFDFLLDPFFWVIVITTSFLVTSIIFCYNIYIRNKEKEKEKEKETTKIVDE